MDYYNLYTKSIWHLNPDGTGFEKVDCYTLKSFYGAFRRLPAYAAFPNKSKLGGL